jgi:hypothetical protein
LFSHSLLTRSRPSSYQCRRACFPAA